MSTLQIVLILYGSLTLCASVLGPALIVRDLSIRFDKWAYKQIMWLKQSCDPIGPY